MEDLRVQTFHLLKPPCVELSQVALRFQNKQATAKDIIAALDSLWETLRKITKQNYTLDSKLAEYAFFPLSHVFRENKMVPVRALELAVLCLQILILRGWRKTITADLAKQLLILLTFLAGGSATEAKSKNVNEELATAAYACLATLFEVSDAAGLSTRGSIDSSNFPVLGHSVSVLLDGVCDGPALKVRLAALDALNGLILKIPDQEALKNLFPGIVSSLTKVLASRNRSNSPFKVLRGCIENLNNILLKVVNDESHSELEAWSNDSTETSGMLVAYGDSAKKSPWLEATSSQVKLALATILPLRYHDRYEVRHALFGLCVTVLTRCAKSLGQSIPMMVETSVIICTQASDVDAIELIDNLNVIFNGNHDLFDVLKTSLRDWMITLPRIMQLNDDIARQRTTNQVSTALSIVGLQSVPFDTVDCIGAMDLQASVSAALQASAAKSIQSVQEYGSDISQVLEPKRVARKSLHFTEVVFNETSQKTTIASLRTLVFKIQALPSSTVLWQNIAQSLETTSGSEQLAGLWLSLQVLGGSRSINGLDWLVEGTHNEQIAQNVLLDQVYSFSLSVLTQPTSDSDADWRLQALSLQAVTLQARHQASNFRPELVDALYPILERLGSSNSVLQHQAVTALSLVSHACDYSSPQELIIENVDYLVNAIALNMGALGITPQAPQVLVMMLRLCGARLIPYLDDLVESIFSLLESYHGYPKFVESMFSVLSSIVEEGNKASATAITEKAEPVRRVPTYKPIGIMDLATQLSEARTRKPHLDPLPSIPDPEAEKVTEASLDSEQQPSDPPSDNPPPLSKTLQTINSIANLAQHHLPTSSPSLRLLLLRLLPSAFAPLSQHQDTLLPLVNSLWPVLITRLYDPELYICIAACQALTSLCRTAGEFLASRFDNEWEKILRLYSRTEKDMVVETKAMGRGGVKQRCWEAVAALIGDVVEWVGVSGEMEHGIFDIYCDSLEMEYRGATRNLRGALDRLNADALWLIEEQARLKGGGKSLDRPVLEGLEFPVLKV